ncbi:MAG: hypothetical protein APR53_04845 [Methanoculleus sp. SDB]|nr:MAG: hypothetical protein APR53_04845 [Methanoculleus sp. SDB]
MIIFLLCLLVVSTASAAAKGTGKADARINPTGTGWEKISESGIVGDPQNSYAWSMEVFDGSLWVGTNRNIFAFMLQQMVMGGMLSDWPPEVPYPTDMRPGIYRMDLDTEEWEEFYRPPQVAEMMALDGGYRMMKTFTAEGEEPALYVGSLGVSARLLAIEKDGTLTQVFITPPSYSRYISIRAIEAHDGRLFWATDDMASSNAYATPALWCSADPLSEPITTIPVPDEWVAPYGAEVLDMVSYHGALYVFLIPYGEEQGFWCGKLTFDGDEPAWELIVGDESLGARYPAGMGRWQNGGAVPVVFKDRVYVGTMDGAAFKLLTGIAEPNPSDITMGGANGMQIFRFDQSDRWERMMPHKSITDPDVIEEQNGFGNPYNKYIWRFGIQDNRLYVGTFDIGTGSTFIGSLMGLQIQTPTPLGFDLYWTTSGEHWHPVTQDGLGDEWNYGARSFVTDPETGTLYLGTANPFYGCQIWKKEPQGQAS